MSGPCKRAFLGLGSNVGDRWAWLEQARSRVAGLPRTTLVRSSAIYLTAPVGGPQQEDYFNQVLEIETTLGPQELLLALQMIERELGRVRQERWGPRTVDVDILWYHGYSLMEPNLTLPHPRLEERRFVLEPLAELAPDLVLASGRTVAEALEQVLDQRVERLRVGDEEDRG